MKINLILTDFFLKLIIFMIAGLGLIFILIKNNTFMSIICLIISFFFLMIRLMLLKLIKKCGEFYE